MTTSARKVLDDCREALSEFHEDMHGNAWRRHWILMVTLLRVVGHVLNNVDGKNKELSEIIERKYNQKESDKILKEFIKKERNNILKEYKFGAGQNITIQVPTTRFNFKTGEQTQVSPPLPTIYDSVINDGPYKGRKQREVIQEAINWWEEYLSDIESEYIKKKI